jgi:hypothetical protein
VGLPDAILFLRISQVGVFQQPLPISLIDPPTLLLAPERFQLLWPTGPAPSQLPAFTPLVLRRARAFQIPSLVGCMMSPALTRPYKVAVLQPGLSIDGAGSGRLAPARENNSLCTSAATIIFCAQTHASGASRARSSARPAARTLWIVCATRKLKGAPDDPGASSYDAHAQWYGLLGNRLDNGPCGVRFLMLHLCKSPVQDGSKTQPR